MITEKGEEVLRTWRINGKPADPIAILTLEIHKAHPDIGNVRDVVVQAIQEFGGPEEALEAFYDGEFDLVPKYIH